MEKFLYFDYLTLLEKHDEVLAKTGGVSGILNEKLIRGCLDFIQNDEYYPTAEDKLTHLVYSISKNHGFVDGNKRTAITIGAYFLEINEYDQYIIDTFMQEMQNVVLLVASNCFSKDDLKRIVYDLINFAEVSDETKLLYVRELGNL